MPKDMLWGRREAAGQESTQERAQEVDSCPRSLRITKCWEQRHINSHSVTSVKLARIRKANPHV